MSTSNDAIVWHGPDDLRSHLVPVGTLKPDPENANTHPDKNLQAIRGSLGHYGQQKPIVVSPSGVIVAGSGLWMALQRPVARPVAAGSDEFVEEQWTHVAVVRSDLSPAGQVGYGVADNRTKDLSEWDLDTLASHLGGMAADGVDLALLGWDEIDVAQLLGDAEPPEGFAEVDEDLETQYECPKCGYEWSGAPS